jgi:NAD(P)-dependent dehydrogenase (short-subunit alcohol dehydrogenase family)
MRELKNLKIVVTGGSRGLGLGTVEALVAKGAQVTVVARDRTHLDAAAKRLGVATIAGDVTDPAVARSVLRDIHPDVLILNAGAPPASGPIDEQTWEGFSTVWNTDVKAGLHWIQEAIRLPLSKGSRVLVASSGAAVEGSPMSGGYAGAKRTLWFMTKYANDLSTEKGLEIRFQALVLRRMIGGTGVGGVGAAAYAKKKGITAEAMLASFGKPMSARDYGEQIVTLLTDPRYDRGVAMGIRDTGIESLDG